MMIALVTSTICFLGPATRAPAPTTTARGVAIQAARSHPIVMEVPYAKMSAFIQQWDDDEDGDSSTCMTGMELEFLAERIVECGEEECSAMLPELENVFDAVLADCDEACVTITKMKKKLAELAA